MIKMWTPGLIISMAGFCGLLFAFIDTQATIGSILPIAIFFFVIMLIGIYLQVNPPDNMDDSYGEVGGKREFS